MASEKPHPVLSHERARAWVGSFLALKPTSLCQDSQLLGLKTYSNDFWASDDFWDTLSL